MLECNKERVSLCLSHLDEPTLVHVKEDSRFIGKKERENTSKMRGKNSSHWGVHAKLSSRKMRVTLSSNEADQKNDSASQDSVRTLEGGAVGAGAPAVDDDLIRGGVGVLERVAGVARDAMTSSLAVGAMGGLAGDTLAILEVVPVGTVQARPANAAGAMRIAAAGGLALRLAGAVQNRIPGSVVSVEVRKLVAVHARRAPASNGARTAVCHAGLACAIHHVVPVLTPRAVVGEAAGAVADATAAHGGGGSQADCKDRSNAQNAKRGPHRQERRCRGRRDQMRS